MPRGRPRKSSLAVSSVSSTSSLTPSANTSSQAAGASDRPVRSRIAVRKFGDEPIAHTSSSTVLQPQQHLTQKSTRSHDCGDGYVLIHKSFWGKMCSKLACSSCGKSCVQMKTEKLSGLAYKLIMYCTSCGVVLSQVTSGPDGDRESESEEEVDYDVNWRFVKFFVGEGKTYEDVVIFSKTLGIPVMSQVIFEKYRDKFLRADE